MGVFKLFLFLWYELTYADITPHCPALTESISKEFFQKPTPLTKEMYI